MLSKLRLSLAHLSWAQRFMLASLGILVAGMVAVGWWVGEEIVSGVIRQTGANTAVYVSSIVEPNLQELATGNSITPEHQAMLARLLQDTSLGQHITTLKVWDKHGRILYDTDTENIGRQFEIDSDLARALRGWVSCDISNVNLPENAFDRDRGKRRLQTYTPVRRTGTNQIIAAVEFYQTTDSLDRDILAAQQRSWLIVGATTLVMYLLLAGFVRYASDTMRRQQNELSSQVIRLKELLSQNETLHERVRRAARHTTALNERFLRRISAELHDGPAQDLGLALLRLNHLLPESERVQPALSPDPVAQPDFQVVQSSLRHALQEIRAISAGMGLPELEHLSLSETIARAVRAHERRTGTPVKVELTELPENVSLPVKITLYRVIQEALSNAYRHAGGAGQEVQAKYEGNQLRMIVSDQGPGFQEPSETEWDQHLGLVGMRERVESLDGNFQIESAVGRGTRVIAQLPLDVT